MFAAFVISGLTTAIQARKLGRIGAGYILVMGSTSAFLAVSVSALEQGGPGMLATLIIASSLIQFVLAARMALLRRIFTPTVAGTVPMLIPVTLAPLILRKLAEVPVGASPAAAPITAGVTLLLTILIPLRFSGALRLWAPAIGIVAGCLTAGLGFGMKILLSEGLDYRKGLVVGGGFTVILFTMFGEITGGRRSRMRIRLTAETWPEIDAFLSKFAARRGWGGEMENRLRAVGEETVQILTRGEAERTTESDRRPLLIVRSDGDAADLEFIATTDETNLEDHLAMLSEGAASVPAEAETPLRLPRHYASSIRHQQYHDIDIPAIRVEAVRGGRVTRQEWAAPSHLMSELGPRSLRRSPILRTVLVRTHENGLDVFASKHTAYLTSLPRLIHERSGSEVT